MKSSRLLTLLLLLQTHHRMTTADLAGRLEVSRRTVLRDVDALSAAGVPVYAERGRHGAIVLMTQARLDAARLDPAEIELLLTPGLDARAVAQLDLGEPAKSATRKLSTRRPPPGRSRRLGECVVVDNTAWADSAPVSDVSELVRDVAKGRRLRLDYRRSGEPSPSVVVADPYGLAIKAGRWYLVADVEAAPRFFALARLSGHDVLDDPATLRPGWDLPSVWEELKARAEPAGDIVVQARLRADRLDLARRVLGSRLAAADPLDDDSRVLISVRYDHPEAVRQLLQFGDHIEVLSPPAARARIGELARQLAETHS